MVKNPHYRRFRGSAVAAGPLTGRTQTGRPALPARFRRLRLTVLGAGDVGARLIAALSHRFGSRLAVLAVTRRPEQAQRLRALGARVLALDLDDRAGLARLAAFGHRLVQLAPPAPIGTDDPRSKRLIAALGGVGKRHGTRHGHVPTPQRSGAAWVYASTTGVYGDVQGVWIDETRQISPNNDRAKRRVKAERQWRRAGRAGLARTPIVRVPGIYAADRLPIERLHKRLPALNEHDDVYTNHINADDLAQVLWLALMRGRGNRVYHAVDQSDLKMGDYFDLVADRLRLLRPPRMTREQIAQAVSPAMLSFMRESRRLHNWRLVRELRCRLRYPTVADTLKSVQPTLRIEATG